MNDQWIRGEFEGTYVGDRQSPADGPGGLRRFSFELHSGAVRDFELLPTSAIEPDLDDEHGSDESDEIRQSRLRRVVLETPTDGEGARETTLFDVRISEFCLKRPAEAGTRAYGTVEGTILARLMPPGLEPRDELAPPPPPAERSPEVPAAKPVARPGKSVRRRSRPQRVEAPGAAEMYARARWSIALFVLAIGALLLGVACGPSTAALWSAPIIAAMGLRGLLGRFALKDAWLHWPLGGALVGAQLWLMASPLAIAWELGCRTSIRADLLPLALPLLGTALLRSRGWLAVTTLLWTGVMCAWCSQIDGTCTGAAAFSGSPGSPGIAETVASEEPLEIERTSSSAYSPRSRTDANGRWPAAPGAPRSGGDGSSIDSPGRVPAFGSPLGLPGALPDLSGMASVPGTSGGSDMSGRPMSVDGGVSPDAVADGVPSRIVATPGGGSASDRIAPQAGAPPAAAPGPAAANAQSRSPLRSSSTPDGGWVAPDHRRTPRELVLISVEHANRLPESFYESDGTRRVYLPSDAIFEAGGSRIQSSGALELSRLAALLSLYPSQRVAIEVHTDASGSVEAQLELSRRRAGQVHRWLLDRGHIESGQIEVAGVGGKRPLVPPDGSYAAQQPNRRLEVRLID